MQSIRNFLNDMDQRKWERDIKAHTDRKERVKSLTQHARVSCAMVRSTC